MNNVKKLSILLLLSMGVGASYAADCSSDCNVSGNNGCSSDCGTGSNDCNNNGCSVSNDCDGKNSTTTVIVPRPLITNLTLRNNMSLYNFKRMVRPNFFTWDTTYAYFQNRRGKCLGAGLLGKNPLVVAEEGGDFNSVNLGLVSEVGDGFKSTVSISPRRNVFAWYNQLYFNLDCFCNGLWADISFAVVHARHKLRFNEVVTTPGDAEGQPTTVREALTNDNFFANDCRRTGVDDVMFRVGYDWNYCGPDYVGIYGLGIAPTGRRFDNARFFQPIVGSKHGAIGAGVSGTYTLMDNECNDSDLVAMTELLYAFRLRHDERRVFDLNNGPLSRFLLGATEDNPGTPVPLLDALTRCVRVEPRHEINWWTALHYQWCNWGGEVAYNLFWKDRERIKCPTFDFGGLGIFDMSCGNLTSNSTATIGQAFNDRVQDPEFVALTAADVNLRSGAAHKALSHTISATVSYNNVFCDCYPWMAAFGGGYEFASRKNRRFTFENWTVYGKLALSF